MWLLNATTEQQRKGLADYFSPTISVARISAGGEGMFGGDSLMSDDVLAQTGTGQAGGLPIDGDLGDSALAAALAAAAEVAALEDIQTQFLGIGGESLIQQEALRPVDEDTPEAPRHTVLRSGLDLKL